MYGPGEKEFDYITTPSTGISQWYCLLPVTLKRMILSVDIRLTGTVTKNTSVIIRDEERLDTGYIKIMIVVVHMVHKYHTWTSRIW